MRKARLEFTTREFERSHFRAPRGQGCWAFLVCGETYWSPSMTYGEAKKWLRGQLDSMLRAGCGTVEAQVQP